MLGFITDMVEFICYILYYEYDWTQYLNKLKCIGNSVRQRPELLQSILSCLFQKP